MTSSKTRKPPTAAHRITNSLGLLLLAAFPLILWPFNGSNFAMSTAAVMLGLLVAALLLIDSGQAEHDAYDADDNAAAPRVPRKIIGSALIGLVVLVLAGHKFAGLILPLMFGAMATGLALAAFGPDPRADKGKGTARRTADRAHTTPVRQRTPEPLVERSEQALSRLVDRVTALNEADLTRRTEAARDGVMRLLRAVSHDPKALKPLRKPVARFVQLLSTEVSRLEEHWDGEGYLFARKRYVAALETLSQTFEDRLRQRDAKSGRGSFDLDADILFDRMRSETAA